MQPEDLSIAYEIIGRPEIGLNALLAEEQRNKNHFYESEPQWQPFINLWNGLNHLSLLGLKSYVIYKLALQTMKLDGQFIECGVFRGGLSFLLAMMLRDSKSTKKVHLCDTFYGLPNPDRDFDKSYVQGGMACDRSEVEGSIRSLGIHNQCVIHEGLFADTFENLHGLDKVSFAHIDCDLYHGTKDCLEYLFPRLSYGAAVVIDDYYDESHGVMTALNEFAESNNIVIHLSTYGQAYFIKGEQALPSSKVTIGNHSVYMVTTSIVQDHAYLPLLERLLNFHETRINRLRNFISFCRREHV